MILFSQFHGCPRGRPPCSASEIRPQAWSDRMKGHRRAHVAALEQLLEH